MEAKTIITAFRQGAMGNCTAIGTIKAAIEIFGVDNVFHHEAGAGGLKVVLKNGNELNVLQAELEYTASHSNFKFLGHEDENEKLQIFKYAHICLAVMSKQKQITEGHPDFEHAFVDLNEAEDSGQGKYWLGLGSHYAVVGYSDRNDYKGIVAHSAGHTVFVSEGYYDNYGDPEKLNSIGERIRFGFGRKWYRFIP